MNKETLQLLFNYIDAKISYEIESHAYPEDTANKAELRQSIKDLCKNLDIDDAEFLWMI